MMEGWNNGMIEARRAEGWRGGELNKTQYSIIPVSHYSNIPAFYYSRFRGF
jgi:hypothetical protein